MHTDSYHSQFRDKLLNCQLFVQEISSSFFFFAREKLADLVDPRPRPK